MNKPLAKKKIIEALAAKLTDSELLVLAKLPQHRRQYVMATDAAHGCRDLAKQHANKEMIKSYLGEVRNLFERSVDFVAKKQEGDKVLAKAITAVNTQQIASSLEDKLFVLMETWSEEKLAAATPATLASRVSILEEICSTVTESDAEADIEQQGEEELGAAVNEETDTFPLNLLLEIAVNHFNKEFCGLLTESQMAFMKAYIVSDPDEFLKEHLVPLEERFGAVARSADAPFPEQVAAVQSVIDKFRKDRTAFSEARHPQHTAAINFYLSLVDLTDRISDSKKE